MFSRLRSLADGLRPFKEDDLSWGELKYYLWLSEELFERDVVRARAQIEDELHSAWVHNKTLPNHDTLRNTSQKLATIRRIRDDLIRQGWKPPYKY